MHTDSRFKSASMRPLDEMRADREELTKLALAQVARCRLSEKRLRQTDVSRWGQMSRSHLLAILGGEKSVSLYLFLELSHALKFEDECDFLRAVIRERNRLREDKAQATSR